MGKREDKIKSLAKEILADMGIEKPRGYISRTEKLLRNLDVEDFDQVVALVHEQKMKDPDAIAEELRRRNEETARKPGIFDQVTMTEIKMEFLDASKLGDHGKTPRRDANSAYDGGGKIETRTSVSYTGGDGPGGGK